MIQRISTRTIDNMKRKSALSLQNKTYTSGMSPQMIKEYFVKLITDSDNSALSELTRVINEANESFVDINSLGAVSGVATLGENGKVLQSQLPHIPNEADYIPQTDKGVNVATLENGKIPSTQLPSYVDDTLEGVLSGGNFLVGGVAIIPETGKIYVDINTNLTYRWSGSIFAEISPSLALGENETTAFSGARGKALETKIGSGTLHTIEQNLIGAINEILEVGVVITNWSVSKEGLNNNHTVTFNDGTTFTFTVTDGAKGKGYNPRWGWEIGKEYSNDNVQIDTAYHNGTTYACKLTHISDNTNTPPNAMYWEVLATGVNPASDINKVTAVNVVGESVTINNTADGYVDEITLEGNTIGGGGTPETPIAIQSVESPVSLVNCDAEIPNEPYQGTTLSIPIKDTIGNALTLRRAGTAYDSVYKENGKWYLRKAINEQVLNGSENWDGDFDTDRFYIAKPDAKMQVSADKLANLIATTHQTKTLFQIIVSGDNGVYLSSGNFGVLDTVTFAGFTVANFKTWLSTHNITIAYELATPEIIELHEDTATALESLKTYQGTTNIFGTNTVNPILDVTELAMGTGEKKYALLTDSNGNAVMPVNEADNVLMSDGKTVEYAITQMLSPKTGTATVLTTAWEVDATYSGYGYRASVSVLGLTADFTGLVSFDDTALALEILKEGGKTYSGGFYVYASEIPSADITIESYIFWEV